VAVLAVVLEQGAPEKNAGGSFCGRQPPERGGGGGGIRPDGQTQTSGFEKGPSAVKGKEGGEGKGESWNWFVNPQTKKVGPPAGGQGSFWVGGVGGGQRKKTTLGPCMKS